MRAEIRKAIDNGHEELVGLSDILFTDQPRCDFESQGKRCSFKAKYLTIDRTRLCRCHAERWAIRELEILNAKEKEQEDAGKND